MMARTIIRQPGFAAAFVPALLSLSLALADTGERPITTAQAGDAASRKAPSPVSVTPAREAAAMTFVGQHHPELVALLINLKENQPKEYDAAIRDLFRTSERLTQTRERDRERYELELKAWQLQSQVQLLTARLRMQADDQVLQQLEDTLRQQHEVQLALLQRDQHRLQERLQKLDEQITRLQQQREQIVQRRLNAVRQTKSDQKPRPPRKSAGRKPAAKKPAAASRETSARDTSRPNPPPPAEKNGVKPG